MSDRSGEPKSVPVASEQTEGGLDVLIPTCRRPGELARCLEALEASDAGACGAVVTVIDNAGDQGTREVIEGRLWNLPVRMVECLAPGKSNALNKGLAASSGDLVVFLDDDMVVSPSAFGALRAGAARWPDAAGFGTRIGLVWPENLPLDRRVIEYVKGFAYASRDYREEERPFPKGNWPLGCFMAFRRRKLPSEAPFDGNTGPKPGTYRMGSGQPLFDSLAKMGAQLVILPSVSASHHVRESQLTEAWILDRSYSWGRSLGHFGGLWRGIRGDAPIGSLLLAWSVRRAREFAMAIRGKAYPRVWAAVDRRVIEGVLFERLFRGGSRSRRIEQEQ